MGVADLGRMRRLVPFLVISAALSYTAAADTAAERARSFLDAQLSMVNAPGKFLATLEPDALILGNGSFGLARGANASAIIATLGASPRSRSPVQQSIVTRLDAGGTADVFWLSADVVMAHSKDAPHSLQVDANDESADRVIGADSTTRNPHMLRVRDITSARIVELVVATATTWRVVALTFVSTSGVSAPGDVIGGSGSGPLIALISSPHDLYAATWDDAATIAFGARPPGIGPRAAHDALAPFQFRTAKLTDALEVHGGHWGIAVGDLVIEADPAASWDSKTRVRLMLFAVVQNGHWKLVGVDTGTIASTPIMIDP